MFRLLLLTLLLGHGVAAVATEYKYTYTAEFLSSSDDPTVDSIADTARPFSSISGTITLDDTLIGPSGDFIEYAAPVITVNEFSLTAIDLLPTSFKVGNDLVFGTSTYDFLTSAYGGLPAQDVDYDIMQFSFRDGTATAVSSGDFPTLIDISAFQLAQIYFFSSFEPSTGGSGFAKERVTFSFTSFELESAPAVPLPASLPALLAGLGAFGLLRRRQT
jgi:hypothetical protein